MFGMLNKWSTQFCLFLYMLVKIGHVKRLTAFLYIFYLIWMYIFLSKLIFVLKLIYCDRSIECLQSIQALSNVIWFHQMTNRWRLSRTHKELSLLCIVAWISDFSSSYFCPKLTHFVLPHESSWLFELRCSKQKKITKCCTKPLLLYYARSGLFQLEAVEYQPQEPI